MPKKRELTSEEKALAERLNRIYYSKRSALGLTQEKLAQSLGFSTQGAVSHYLRGINPLGLEAGLKFASALEVKPSEINPKWAEYDGLEPDQIKRYREILPILEKLPEEKLRRCAELLEAVDLTSDEQVDALLVMLRLGNPKKEP